MKKSALAGISVMGVIVVLAFGLAGCSSNKPTGEVIQEIEYTLKDGRTVVCLIPKPMNSGSGLSCDWENAS